jgi:hypothetical protein
MTTLGRDSHGLLQGARRLAKDSNDNHEANGAAVDDDEEGDVFPVSAAASEAAAMANVCEWAAMMCGIGGT